MNFRVDIGIAFGRRGMNPRPATKGAYPLGIPDDRFLGASRRKPTVKFGEKVV